MIWTIIDGRPIWQQLAEQLRRAIATGIYPLGDRVPPVRELALEAGVNPNTMQRALAQLETEGLLITNRTAGRTVTDDPTVRTNLRHALATETAQHFYTQMEQLGFSQATAIQFLAEQEEQ